MSFPHSIVNVPKIPSSIAQTCLKLKMTFIDNKVCLVKTDMSIVSTSQYRECQSVHIRVLRSQYRLMPYPTSDVFHRLCRKFWTWAVTAHTSYSVRYCYISQPLFPKNFFRHSNLFSTIHLHEDMLLITSPRYMQIYLDMLHFIHKQPHECARF